MKIANTTGREGDNKAVEQKQESNATMQQLSIKSVSDESNSHNVEVESTTTLLELRYQLFSLTDIPPERLLLHVSGTTWHPDDEVDTNTTILSAGITATATVTYSDSENPPCASPSTQAHASKPPKQTINLDDVKAALQQCTSKSKPSATTSTRKTEEFLARVRSYYEDFLQYEDKQLQEKALQVVPLEKLRSQASDRLQKDPKYPTYEHAIAKELLHWFKNSFFTWLDTPACWSCNEKTKLIGVLQPSESEKQHKASRTELFGCPACGAETSFPRYNDAAKLLGTRRGRCGEWARTFTLIARAAGLRVRAVHDWTDHVWTEIWCGRWIHADSCEDELDRPLLYEVGWKKKLNYCIATGLDGVVDVTRRYTENFEALRERRTLADENSLQAGLKYLHRQALERLDTSVRREAVKRHEQDLAELAAGPGGVTEALPGRQSGCAHWVESRGEDGSGK